jgi:hypothetical protein
MEANPAALIRAPKTAEFISYIMYQFGVPNNIINDNGTQFTAREFKNFCDNIGIKVNYSSVSHR